MSLSDASDDEEAYTPSQSTSHNKQGYTPLKQPNKSTSSSLKSLLIFLLASLLIISGLAISYFIGFKYGETSQKLNNLNHNNQIDRTYISKSHSENIISQVNENIPNSAAKKNIFRRIKKKVKKVVPKPKKVVKKVKKVVPKPKKVVKQIKKVKPKKVVKNVVNTGVNVVKTGTKLVRAGANIAKMTLPQIKALLQFVKTQKDCLCYAKKLAIKFKRKNVFCLLDLKCNNLFVNNALCDFEIGKAPAYNCPHHNNNIVNPGDNRNKPRPRPITRPRPVRPVSKDSMGGKESVEGTESKDVSKGGGNGGASKDDESKRRRLWGYYGGSCSTYIYDQHCFSQQDYNSGFH